MTNRDAERDAREKEANKRNPKEVQSGTSDIEISATHPTGPSPTASPASPSTPGTGATIRPSEVQNRSVERAQVPSENAPDPDAHRMAAADAFADEEAGGSTEQAETGRIPTLLDKANPKKAPPGRGPGSRNG
jgi:hypothetical protein